MNGTYDENATRHSKGEALLKEGKHQEASDIFSEILLHSNNPYTYSCRALCHYSLGKYEEAIEDCNKCLKQFGVGSTEDKELGNSVINLRLKATMRRAKSYLKLKEYEKCIEDCQNMTELIRKTAQKVQFDDKEILESVAKTEAEARKGIEEREKGKNGYVSLSTDDTDSQMKDATDNNKEEEAKEGWRLLTQLESASHSMKEGSIWHLISVKWLDAWQKYVGIFTPGPAQDPNAMVDSDHVPEAEKITPTASYSANNDFYPHPGPITNSELISKEEVAPDPDKTKAYSNVVVAESVREKEDYVLVDHNTWKFFFDKYGGVDIKRFVISLSDDNNETMVEVHLKKVKFYLIPLLQNYNMDGPKTVLLSRKETLRDVKDKLLRIILGKPSPDSSLRSKIKLWKPKPGTTYKRIEKMYDEQSRRSSSKLAIDARALDDNVVLEDAELAESDVLIVEAHTKDGWHFKETVEDRIMSRKPELSEDITSQLQSTANDKLGFISIPMTKICGRDGRKGLVGLQNLGNTCFMNSGLQCLSHTTELTKYFLLGIYKHHLNESNGMGTGGRLAEAYAYLMDDLWRGSDTSTSPWTLKKVIGRYATQFMGFSQHDSGELLTFLLDFLNEDLNLIRKKPYIEYRDHDENCKDEEASQEFWDGFTKRNQSIIVDLMYGQLKSRLTCLQCKKISVTFDPFLTLSVPIPTNQKMGLYLVPKDPLKPMVHMNIAVTDSTSVKEIIARVAAEEKIQLSNSVLCRIKDNEIKEKYEQKKAGEFYLYELSPPEEGKSIRDYILLEVRIVQEKKRMISGTYIDNVTIPRLLAILRGFTVGQLRLYLFSLFRKVIKNPSTARMGSEKEQILSDYEHYFGSTNNGEAKPNVSDLYSIQILNNLPIKREGLFGATRHTCEFCKEAHKGNCELNLKESITIYDIHNDIMKHDRDLVLILQWVNNPSAQLNFFNETIQKHQPSGHSTKKTIQLYDCIEGFSQEELLEKDNQWYCSKCKKHQNALKKLDIYRLPRILIINLKRFKHKVGGYSMLGGSSKKIGELIDFPTTGLDLSRYIKREKDRDSPALYDLFAVSNHMGSLFGGHYTAYCKNNDRWVEFDDSTLSSVSEKEVVSSAAYVLFYRKRDS